MLEQLGLARLRSWTPWTDGQPEFEGVPGAAADGGGRRHRQRGARERAQRLREPPFRWRTSQRYPVLLATRIDGQQLEVRDKGPIWIVYPWSTNPELDDLPTRRKSVWQLRSLHVQ